MYCTGLVDDGEDVESSEKMALMKQSVNHVLRLIS